MIHSRHHLLLKCSPHQFLHLLLMLNHKLDLQSLWLPKDLLKPVVEWLCQRERTTFFMLSPREPRWKEKRRKDAKNLKLRWILPQRILHLPPCQAWTLIRRKDAKKFEIEMDFAPEDLALATVPGMDFDPKERAFDLEELRPQPIIRKRKKTAVPEEMKDDKYWEKRIKNKVATGRSREARRLKENQIALRAAFLEKENATMKQALESSQFEKTKISMEIEILKQKLAQYEA